MPLNGPAACLVADVVGIAAGDVERAVGRQGKQMAAVLQQHLRLRDGLAGQGPVSRAADVADVVGGGKRVLKESDVVLYAIGILGGSDVGSSLGMEGQSILDEMAGVSGGKAFYPRSPAEMDDIFEQIALELRHQYSIGYRPPNFVNDGKWHRVKVKVNPPRGLPRLFVRSKEGYYAIANPK